MTHGEIRTNVSRRKFKNMEVLGLTTSGGTSSAYQGGKKCRVSVSLVFFASIEGLRGPIATQNLSVRSDAFALLALRLDSPPLLLVAVLAALAARRSGFSLVSRLLQSASRSG